MKNNGLKTGPLISLFAGYRLISAVTFVVLQGNGFRFKICRNYRYGSKVSMFFPYLIYIWIRHLFSKSFLKPSTKKKKYFFFKAVIIIIGRLVIF